ncbi:MAG: hypothetical protein ACJAZ9_002119 [Neolewinella sp.]|jgi:uncharacterized protein (DUF2141 family)
MHLLVLLSLLLVTPTPPTVTLTITTSVEKSGNLHVAVYDCEEGFADGLTIASAVRPTGGGTVSLDITLPETGNYVLAAFHDLNDNGKLDTNLMGVPTEPYGFGREAPSKWRAPNFGEVSTKVEGSGVETILLKKWKEY